MSSKHPLLAQAQELVEARRWKEALPLLLDLAANEPESEQVHYTLGHVYFKLNDLVKANVQLSKAIALDSMNPASHYLMGEVQAGCGFEEDAIVSYRRATEIDPNYERSARRLHAGPHEASAGRETQWTEKVAASSLEMDVRPRKTPYLLPGFLAVVVAFIVAFSVFGFLGGRLPRLPVGMGVPMTQAGAPVDPHVAEQAAEANARARADYELQLQRETAQLTFMKTVTYGGLVIFFSVVLGINLLNAMRTRYILGAGRIIVKQGLFRTRDSIEMSRIIDSSVRQTPLTLISGDAYLVIQYDAGGQPKQVSLLGLARFAELVRIQDALREAVLRINRLHPHPQELR